MSLTFRQLLTFREVMLSGTLAEAGRSVGRTQPAVWSAIAKLEGELGFSLFERERGRLVPKPEAHYFLEEAEAVLTRLDQSTRTLREIGDLERGMLRVAANPASSAFVAPKAVARFLEGRPEVNLSLMTRSSVVIQEWIASQQYDVGIAETPAPRRALDITAFDIPCVCAVPAAGALAAKQTIAPLDLDGQPMAALFKEHFTWVETAKAFADAGAKLERRFEVQNFLPALQLVEEGLCTCVCDPLSAISYAMSRGEEFGIVFRPFEPTVAYSIAVLTPAYRPLSLLAAAFRDFLVTEFERLEETVPWFGEKSSEPRHE
jgi:DNA-binding transcriptional LysR family regulator